MTFTFLKLLPGGFDIAGATILKLLPGGFDIAGATCNSLNSACLKFFLMINFEIFIVDVHLKLDVRGCWRHNERIMIILSSS